MKPTLGPRLAAIAYLALLTAGLLFPFDFTRTFEIVPNRVAWSARPPGIEFRGRGIVETRAAPRNLFRRLTRSSGFTVEAWVTPATVDQGGPARIVTYSFDTSFRNFMLGQERTALAWRLRTTETDLNGIPEVLLDDVFRAGREVQVVVTCDAARLTIYVDGEARLSRAAPAGSRIDWEPDYSLAFGNELTGNRPWTGTLRLAAIYATALDGAQVRRNLAAGIGPAKPDGPPGRVVDALLALYRFDEGAGTTVFNRADGSGNEDLQLPPTLLLAERRPLQNPISLRGLRWAPPATWLDIGLNVLIFVPVGYLGHAWLGARRRSRLAAILGAALIGFLLSLAIESAQYFLEHRVSSRLDVVVNSFGSWVGIAGYRWVHRRVRGSLAE